MEDEEVLVIAWMEGPGTTPALCPIADDKTAACLLVDTQKAAPPNFHPYLSSALIEALLFCSDPNGHSSTVLMSCYELPAAKSDPNFFMASLQGSSHSPRRSSPCSTSPDTISGPLAGTTIAAASISTRVDLRMSSESGQTGSLPRLSGFAQQS